MSKNLSMAALATMVFRLPSRDSSYRILTSLESTFLNHRHLISRVDLSYVLQSYAKMNLGSAQFYEGMADTAKRNIGKCNTLDLVNILSAFVKARYENIPLYLEIERALIGHKMNFKDMALVLNAFSKINARFEIFDRLEDTVISNKTRFNAQQISMILNAYSVAKPESGIFKEFESTVLGMQHDKKSLQTIIYAYFKAGYRNSPIIHSSNPRFEDYNIQELVNLYRVYVSYDDQFIEFLDIIEDSILKQTPKLTSQPISNLIDYASIRLDRLPFVEKLANILDSNIDLFNSCMSDPHYLVMIIHGLSKYNTSLSLISKSIPLIPDLPAEESAILFYSLKKISFQVPDFLTTKILTNLDKLAPKHLINLGFIMSKYTHYDPSFWKVFKPHYLSFIQSFSPTSPEASTQITLTLSNLQSLKEEV